MTDKQAISDYPIHDLVATRWSPYAFDSKPMPAEDLRSLLEAARWAPSSYNEQPWRYIVAMRDDGAAFERALACLLEGNVAWAKHASAILFGVTSQKFSRNGKPNTAAEHDLGLASANLSLEATARGYAVHQMIGIRPDAVREQYAVPEDFRPLTALAIGYAASADTLPESMRGRDDGPRGRNPQGDFVFAGTWGECSTL